MSKSNTVKPLHTSEKEGIQACHTEEFCNTEARPDLVEVTQDEDQNTANLQAGMPYSPQELGRRGEKAAQLYLQRKGYEILDCNWVCDVGEADIIAFDEENLVFVEVKTRQGLGCGFPEDALTKIKRSKYERIAAWYLSDHAFEDCRVRFDVISILALGNGKAFLRHHINAFVRGDLA